MPVELPKRDRVLLLGSVRLDTVEDVMKVAASVLDGRLARLPDGEVAVERGGPARGFVNQLRPVVTENPALEPDPAEAALGHRQNLAVESHRDTRPPRYRLRSGTVGADVKIATTGLAETALASFQVFKRLRAAGQIPPNVRFQFCLPTVAAFLNTHVLLSCHDAIEGPYQHALFNDVTRIAAAVPADRLTLQWDVSTEMAQWEGVREAHFSPVQDGIIERLALHCDHVPMATELGIHLCYGNFGLRHWREPSDLGNCVAVFNGIAARASRPIDYVHMPVPIDRDDDSYFAPLDALQLGPNTKLYLGLVHERDGIDGARRRIAAARRHAERFGIATECGFGSRPPEVIPDLLRLHAEIADSLLD